MKGILKPVSSPIYISFLNSKRRIDKKNNIGLQDENNLRNNTKEDLVEFEAILPNTNFKIKRSISLVYNIRQIDVIAWLER
ncbi:hypothetical protein H312_01640 [Anncaliia algerae PRA339]|uniref:Uncharacterized protein n=1 Tax=Anncaliia algerae PRA339 TaxID=1288291 RepID=A0A059F1D5_9MICR|nr:hypothetical protein H312_01640 [Anncaliia algerae PRA339]